MQMTWLAKSFLEHGQGKVRKGKEKPFPWAAWSSLHRPPCRARSKLPHLCVLQAGWLMSPAVKEQARSSLSRASPNLLSSRASAGTFTLSFIRELLFSQGSCPQSLPELRCRRVRIVAVPGCTYPADVAWTLTCSPSSVSLPQTSPPAHHSFSIAGPRST